MIVPADKYILNDYRVDVGTPAAPQMIDTDVPLQPVKIVGMGLPRPNTKQTIKHMAVLKSTGASATTQLATSTPSLNIYFLGAMYGSTATVGTAQVNIDDATTGSPTITDGSTTQLGSMQATAVSLNYAGFPSVPIKCINGLRVQCVGPTTGSAFAFIYWMEEIV